jgi:hypothetical protein
VLSNSPAIPNGEIKRTTKYSSHTSPRPQQPRGLRRNAGASFLFRKLSFSKSLNEDGDCDDGSDGGGSVGGWRRRLLQGPSFSLTEEAASTTDYDGLRLDGVVKVHTALLFTASVQG